MLPLVTCNDTDNMRSSSVAQVHVYLMIAWLERVIVGDTFTQPSNALQTYQSTVSTVQTNLGTLHKQLLLITDRGRGTNTTETVNSVPSGTFSVPLFMT